MGMTPEAKVKAAAKKLFEKYEIWYHFVGNNGFGNSGCPDALCCVNGKFLAVEFKADDKKKPTALQDLAMEGIRASHGCALVIHKDNLHDLEFVIKHLLGDRP